MNGIFRYKNQQPVNWFHRWPSKSNQYCLFCGRFVGDGSNLASNKEHLIGREFVPTGAFGDGTLFNFIFRSCKKCNDKKSVLERHLSTVTLFSSPLRRASRSHDALAQRKASKDFHPDKKGILVRDSSDQLKIFDNSGTVKTSFGFYIPPQPNPEFVELLAFRHIQGIFSLITSQNACSAEGTRLLHSKHFYFHNYYGFGDWGNPQVIEIMARAKGIPCHVNINTADGFFKVIMRRSPGDLGEWFWALEWNKSLRTFGALSQGDSIPAVFRNLPQPKSIGLYLENGPTMMRSETALSPEQDILFDAEVESKEDD